MCTRAVLARRRRLQRARRTREEAQLVRADRQFLGRQRAVACRRWPTRARRARRRAGRPRRRAPAGVHALCRSRVTPADAGGASGLNGALDVGLRALGHARDDLAAGRVDDLPRRAVDRIESSPPTRLWYCVAPRSCCHRHGARSRRRAPLTPAATPGSWAISSVETEVGEPADVGQGGVGQRHRRLRGTAPGMLATQ